MELLSVWKEVWAQTGVHRSPARLKGMYQNLLKQYGEPHRAYHTREHIRSCLQLWVEIKETLVQPHAVALALFFHDAIYDPRRQDNEARSALLFEEVGRLSRLDTELVARVCDMIQATKHHQSDDPDTQAMLDIDLSILGASPAVFAQFEAGIRKEYSWVPEELYRRERARIMQTFLVRDTLFYKPFFRERFDAQARVNLAGLVAHLSKPT